MLLSERTWEYSVKHYWCAILENCTLCFDIITSLSTTTESRFLAHPKKNGNLLKQLGFQEIGATIIYYSETNSVEMAFGSS